MARKTGRKKDQSTPGQSSSAPPTSPKATGLDLLAANLEKHHHDQVYRVLIESAGSGIVAIGRDGRYLFVNEETARRLGQRPEQLLGKTVRQVLGPRQGNLAMQRIKQVIDSGSRATFEFAFDDQQGVRHYLSNVEPLLDNSGRVTAVVAVTSDVTEKVHAQQEAKDARQRLRQLIDSTWDIIFQVAPDGRIIFGNRSAERIVGYKLEQLLEMSVFDLIAPEFADELRQRLARQARRKRVPQPFRSQIIRSDGRRVWLEVGSTPMFEKGRLAAVTSIARDVTRQVETEQALEASQQRLKSVLDASRDMVYRFNVSNRRLEYVSPAASEVTGFSPRSIMRMGAGVYRRMHPDDIARFEELRDALASGREDVSQELEYRWRGRDGRYHWFRDSFVLAHDQQTGDLLIIGTIKDITQSREVQRQLRESEERLRAILSSLVDVSITVIDEAGRIEAIWGNPRVETRHGYRFEQFIGRKIEELLGPEQAKAVLANIRGVIRTGQPYRAEERIKMPGGDVWLDSNISPLRDAEGNIVAAVGFHVDVTARKLAEQEAQQARLELLGAREHERRRVARELHDSVGQQLVAVKLATQALLRMCNDCRVSGAHEVLERLSERLNRLILEVREISHGLYPATLEQIGLVGALEQLADDLREHGQLRLRFGRRCGQLRFELPVEIELFRIAQEAVTNALRHGPAGPVDVLLTYSRGLLTLTVKNRSEEELSRSELGVGVESMRQRGAAIGASLEIWHDDGLCTLRVAVKKQPISDEGISASRSSGARRKSPAGGKSAGAKRTGPGSAKRRRKS
jgi:PAS domain S-box-containing protein